MRVFYGTYLLVFRHPVQQLVEGLQLAQLHQVEPDDVQHPAEGLRLHLMVRDFFFLTLIITVKLGKSGHGFHC